MKKFLLTVAFACFMPAVMMAEETMEEPAIAVVKQFFDRLNGEAELAFNAESMVFGDGLLLGAVLYIQTGAMNKAGQWINGEPEYSLFWKLIRKKRDIFHFGGKDTPTIMLAEKLEGGNVWVVAALYCSQYSNYADINDKPLTQTILFFVRNDTVPQIDMLQSTINGESIASLLGFEIREVESETAGYTTRNPEVFVRPEAMELLQSK